MKVLLLILGLILTLGLLGLLYVGFWIGDKYIQLPDIGK